MSDLPVIRSEGQARFLQVTGSLRAIAEQLGVRSPQSVADWRIGRRQPTPGARAKIEALYNIPKHAWHVLPGSRLDGDPAGAPVIPLVPGGFVGAPAPDAGSGPDPDLIAAPSPSSLEDCLALLAVLRKDRQREGLLPADRIRLTDAEGRILSLRARLEQANELAEDRYVRDHPAFRRFCNLVIEALEPHPAAAKAVQEAISRAIRIRDNSHTNGSKPA